MTLIETKKLPERQAALHSHRQERQKRGDLAQRADALKGKPFSELTKKEKDDLLQIIAEKLELVALP